MKVENETLGNFLFDLGNTIRLLQVQNS